MTSSTRGEQALLAGDFAAAATLLGEAVASPDATPGDYANLGAALHLLGRIDEALEAYRRGRASDGDRTPMLAYNHGTLLASIGRSDEARSAYRRALELEPAFENAHENLIALLLSLGDAEAARSACDQALASLPGSTKLLIALGNCCRATGDHDAALAAFERAVASAPSSVEAHRHLGRALVDAGRLDDAETSYRAALALAPRDAWTLNALGALLERRGRLTEAEEILRRAIADADEWSMSHYNLGVVLDRQDRADEAVQSYQRAVALGQHDHAALKNLAGALRRLGRDREAADAYRRALELRPDDAVAAHLLDGLEGRTTDAAPADYVRVLFDDYAGHYSQHMVEKLQYRGPEHVRAALDRLRPGARFRAGVDLGCGTGLVGLVLRDRVDELVGVDLSPRMLDQARETGVYDRLVLDDVVAGLAGWDGALELCTAAEVLVYLGDLAPLMRAAADAMAPGGVLLFSVEQLDDTDGRSFVLTDSGRYAHGEAYLRALASEHGFEVIAWEALSLRIEKSGPARGWLIAFQR